MNVLLTGATGYLGSAIGESLVRAGHAVTALVRSDDAAQRVVERKMRALHGSLREPHAIHAEGFDAIVHAGIESGADRLDVDRAFAEALASATFVYTSTMFVLGNVAHATEETRGSGPRAETEQLVLARGGAVIRAGYVLDEESWMRESPLYIGEGENRWPVVHRRDAAELYRMIVETGARGMFHAVGDVLASRRVAQALGDARSLSIDDARNAMGAFADALALDQHVTATRAHALGWQPRRFARFF